MEGEMKVPAEHPVLTPEQAAKVLRRQDDDHLPIALESMEDPPGLERELAKLREYIRRAGKHPMTVEAMPITARMAEAMLHLRFKRNRKINQAWVEKLKVILLAGRFHGEIARAVFDWDGDMRDSQHRLTAIAETGVVVKMDVKFGVNPAAFPAMDVGLRRTAGQNLDLAGVRHGHTMAAVIRLQYRIEYDGLSPDDEEVFLRGEELSDDIMLTAFVCAKKLRAKKKVIESSAALAYRLIATGSPNAIRLDAFWARLVIGDELAQNSPIFKLRELFDRDRDVKARKVHQFMTQTRHAAWIILAWNAWVQGRTAVLFTWDKMNELPAVK
jgi:hypothetical protein